MLFQIHSWRSGYTAAVPLFSENSEVSRVIQKNLYLSSEAKQNNVEWRARQPPPERVNKGDPQPPLENDGRKNKTKWREATSPFGASKRKLNPSGGDTPLKVGSGKIVDSIRVEWIELSWTAAGPKTRQISKRCFPTVKGWEELSERIFVLSAFLW